jgi:hypothetical protein
MGKTEEEITGVSLRPLIDQLNKVTMCNYFAYNIEKRLFKTVLTQGL